MKQSLEGRIGITEDKLQRNIHVTDYERIKEC
jgi:hypothetical protein